MSTSTIISPAGLLAIGPSASRFVRFGRGNMRQLLPTTIAGDTRDEIPVVAAAGGGALDITTVSDDSTGHLNLVCDGSIYAKVPDQLEFSIVNLDIFELY